MKPPVASSSRPPLHASSSSSSHGKATSSSSKTAVGSPSPSRRAQQPPPPPVNDPPYDFFGSSSSPPRMATFSSFSNPAHSLPAATSPLASPKKKKQAPSPPPAVDDDSTIDLTLECDDHPEITIRNDQEQQTHNKLYHKKVVSVLLPSGNSELVLLAFHVELARTGLTVLILLSSRDKSYSRLPKPSSVLPILLREVRPFGRVEGARRGVFEDRRGGERGDERRGRPSPFDRQLNFRISLSHQGKVGGFGSRRCRRSYSVSSHCRRRRKKGGHDGDVGADLL